MVHRHRAAGKPSFLGALWPHRSSFYMLIWFKSFMANSYLTDPAQKEWLLQSNDLNIWNCSQFPIFANFLILGAAAGSRKTGGMVPLSSAIAPSTSVNCAQLCVFTHFSQIVEFSHLLWHTGLLAATNVFIRGHSSCSLSSLVGVLAIALLAIKEYCQQSKIQKQDKLCTHV